MSMSPKLDGFGRDLLKKIDERKGSGPADDGAAVQLKHLPAQGQGWALVETPNFRVFHRQPRELAETRGPRRRGDPRQHVPQVVRRRPRRLEAALRPVPARHRPGLRQGHRRPRQLARPFDPVAARASAVLSRRIDLHCDDANMFVGVLPHETTHVVLAGRFGEHLVPRWADEGMAVLSEPRDTRRAAPAQPAQAQPGRQLFGVGQLMQLNDYPEPRYIGPFYAAERVDGGVPVEPEGAAWSSPSSSATVSAAATSRPWSATMAFWALTSWIRAGRRYALQGGNSPAMAGRTP